MKNKSTILDIPFRMLSLLSLAVFISIQAKTLNLAQFESIVFIGTLVSISPLADLGSQSAFQRFLGSLKLEGQESKMLFHGKRYFKTNSLILVIQATLSSSLVVLFVKVFFANSLPLAFVSYAQLFVILVLNFFLSLFYRFCQVLSRTSIFFFIQAISTFTIIARVNLEETYKINFSYFLGELVVLYLMHLSGIFLYLLIKSKAEVIEVQISQMSWTQSMDLKVQLIQLISILNFFLLNSVFFKTNEIGNSSDSFQFYQRIYVLIMSIFMSYAIGSSFRQNHNSSPLPNLLRSTLISVLPFYSMILVFSYFGVLSYLNFPILGLIDSIIWASVVIIQIHNSVYTLRAFVSKIYFIPFVAGSMQLSCMLLLLNSDLFINSPLHVLFVTQSVFLMTTVATRFFLQRTQGI